MTDDQLLTDNDKEAGLSLAYVHAVATHAGYHCHEPAGPDRDSVDAQISAGGAMRPKLDIQLKASVGLVKEQDAFKFNLKIKNYNDLRETTQTPRLLVVLDLPKLKDEWLLISAGELVLRRAAYWVDLRGQPETANTSAIQIKIPTANVFDMKALTTLMKRSRDGWPVQA